MKGGSGSTLESNSAEVIFKVILSFQRVDSLGRIIVHNLIKLQIPIKAKRKRTWFCEPERAKLILFRESARTSKRTAWKVCES